MSFQLAQGRSQWKDKSQMHHSAIMVCWKISVAYKSIDEGCLQNTSEK
jgi:hypothetical protein